MPDQLSVTLCVDALAPSMGGVGRYTWELSQRLADETRVGEINYYANGRLLADPGTLLNGTNSRRRRVRRVIERWKAHRAFSRTLVHSTNYFLPEAAPIGVITVHDLSVFRFPETHPLERIRQFERLFESSLRRAVHIITDTETVRHELAQTFQLGLEQITAVPLGVSELFRPAVARALPPALQGWGLERGSYGLCVATVEPRKKLLELVRTWRRLPRAIRDRVPLAVAGGAGWNNDEILDEMRTAQQEGWLRHLGHVKEADLPALYAGAALFVYPSIYEGFGLPPLEAMASGVPVIVSNQSCLSEVCGEAAFYVDPDDDNGFLGAILQGLEDDHWRDNAVRQGLARSARFTWERCTEDTVAVYHSAVRS